MKKQSSLRNWRLATGLALLVSAGVSVVIQSAPTESTTKDAVLQSIVRNVIAPGYQELAVKCGALRGAVEGLVKAPTQESLDAARKAWIAALLAARRIQWLQSGPIADREYLASFYYGKVLAVRMDELLKSSRAIDDSYLREMGPNARGMFALEYLLFDRKSGIPDQKNPIPSRILELFSDARAPRRGEYVLVLAQDLETKAGELARDWTAEGDSSAAARFTAAGQASLNRTVNEVAALIEQISEQRISFVLHLPQPVSRQLERIEGSTSGTSQQSSAALLQGLQNLYLGGDGGGLRSYVNHLNAPLAERVQRELETAIATVEAIGVPLEQAVAAQSGPAEKAYAKTKALEVLCKTDLASALGITITVSSNDGD